MQAMETLVLEFGEIDDSSIFKVELAAISNYSNLIKNYAQGAIDGSVSVRNIGKGADWSVIVLTITGIFFAIPETHKKVGRIHNFVCEVGLFTISIQRSREAFAKDNGELIGRFFPSTWWHLPIFNDITQGQEQQLRGRFIVREVAAIFHNLA